MIVKIFGFYIAKENTAVVIPSRELLKLQDQLYDCRKELKDAKEETIVLRATIKMLRDDIARMKRKQEYIERKPRRKERIGGAK